MTFSRLLVAAIVLSLASTAALAHAHLVSAVPAAGGTVKAAPDELQLIFSERVVAALCGIEIASAAGAKVPAAKPSTDATDPKTLHVRLDHPLAPGAYVVHWRAIAADTHKTSGSYGFTVAP